MPMKDKSGNRPPPQTQQEVYIGSDWSLHIKLQESREWGILAHVKMSHDTKGI